MKFSPASLSCALFGATLLTTSLLACDPGEADEPTELRAMPAGAVPSDPPAPCGDAAELPESAVLVSSTADKVAVSVGFEDVEKAMTGATAIEYSCACNGEGACQVQVVGGKYVQCYSKSCSDCTLNETKASAVRALDHLATSCDPGVVDDEAAAARADAVAAWTADQGYPAPVFSEDGHEATAPEGFGLVVEEVGGRALTYAVPLDHFDEDGDLLDFVGPDNAGAGTIAQVVGGSALSCYCDGSGMCGFVPSGLCKGICGVSEGQRGCVVRSSKPLIPITW